jgi:hypothetical protein
MGGVRLLVFLAASGITLTSLRRASVSSSGLALIKTRRSLTAIVPAARCEETMKDDFFSEPFPSACDEWNVQKEDCRITVRSMHGHAT